MLHEQVFWLLTNFLFTDYCRVLNTPKPVILLIDKSVQVQIGFGTCYQFDMKSSWIAVSTNVCVIRRFSHFSKFVSHGNWIFHERKYESFLIIHCKVSLGLAIFVKHLWPDAVHLYKHCPILSQWSQQFLISLFHYISHLLLFLDYEIGSTPPNNWIRCCCLSQHNRTSVFKVIFFIHCCWCVVRFPKSVLQIKIYKKWQKLSQLKLTLGSEDMPHSKTKFLFCVWRHLYAQNNWLSHTNYFVVLVYLGICSFKNDKLLLPTNNSNTEFLFSDNRSWKCHHVTVYWIRRDNF
jgi:hypothetical protein